MAELVTSFTSISLLCQHCDTQFVSHAAAQLYIHVVIGHSSIIIHHKFLWTHGCCGEVIIINLYQLYDPKVHRCLMLRIDFFFNVGV